MFSLVKPSGPVLFFVRRFLTTNSISLIDIGLVRFYISSVVSFGNLFLHGGDSFHLRHRLYCSQYPLTTILMSLGSDIICLLLFLTLLIHLFFLISFAWFINFIDLLKTLCFIDFSLLFFVSYFINYSLLLPLLNPFFCLLWI